MMTETPLAAWRNKRIPARFGPASVPVVVKPEDRELTADDKVLLRDKERVRFQTSCVVVAGPERRLVGNDEILVGYRGSLKHAERRHDGCGDPSHHDVWLACVKRIRRRVPPRRSKARFDPIDNLLSRQGVGLRTQVRRNEGTGHRGMNQKLSTRERLSHRHLLTCGEHGVPGFDYRRGHEHPKQQIYSY